MGEEHPGRAEEALALELEDVPVVVDQGGDVAGRDVGGQLGDVDGQGTSCQLRSGPNGVWSRREKVSGVCQLMLSSSRGSSQIR